MDGRSSMIPYLHHFIYCCCYWHWMTTLGENRNDRHQTAKTFPKCNVMCCCWTLQLTTVILVVFPQRAWTFSRVFWARIINLFIYSLLLQNRFWYVLSTFHINRYITSQGKSRLGVLIGAGRAYIFHQLSVPVPHLLGCLHWSGQRLLTE